MTEKYQVTLTLEGLHSQEGHPGLDDFVTAVRDFRDALRAIEKEVSGDKSALELRVVALSHQSPASVTVEAFRRIGARDVREEWIARVNSSLRSVASRENVDTLPLPLLKKVRQLSKGVGNKIAALRIGSSADVLSLDQQTYFETSRIIEDVRHYETVASGGLDTIDFHGGANRFVVYPTHGKPSRIACSFPPSLADNAHDAVRKRVEIKGIGRFRRGQPYPILILVNSLLVLPSDSDLPSLSDLRGLAPDIVGDISSEEFVRGLRDGWA